MPAAQLGGRLFPTWFVAPAYGDNAQRILGTVEIKLPLGAVHPRISQILEPHSEQLELLPVLLKVNL